MKNKCAGSVSIIGGADGPTSVFIAGRNKRSWKQKIRKYLYQKKRNRVVKKLRANPHSMDEVIEYTKAEYGCVELEKYCTKFNEEYRQLREAMIVQHRSELLGDFSNVPQINFQAKEDVEEFVRWQQQRLVVAEQVTVEQFDIDLHILESKSGHGQFEIVFEKKYGHIGASASGSKKYMKKFGKIYRDIISYYGVCREDIDNQTERLKALVAALAD